MILSKKSRQYSVIKARQVNAKYKIETFKQGKKHIVNFIIKFKALAMKIETNNIYVIFLLKKNIKSNIIKTILGYLFIAAPEILQKWKMAIILVG